MPDIVSIDVTNMSSSIALPAYNYSIGSLTSDTITVSNIDLSGFNWDTFDQTEFVNCFPNFTKVKEMCDQYPGLEIALKKFQEVYKIVEDDYLAQKGQKYVP